MKLVILISTLIAFFFSTFSTARANPVVTEGNAAVADTVKAKKERVKKKPSQTKTKQADYDDFDDAAYTSEPEEETSFWGACLGSLCGSAMGSMCGSTGSDDIDYEVESHISAADDYPYKHNADLTYYRGNIEPVDPTKNGVELWDKPGGYEADGFVLGYLQRGAEVTVIQFDYYKITRWALVTNNEPGSIEGWVLERDMVPIPEQGAEGRIEEEQIKYLTPFEPGTSTISPTYVRERPKFVFLAEFSYPVFTNKSIREEYNNGDSTKFAYRLGAEAGLFVSKTVNIGFSFGYLNAEGKPLYDYEAPGSMDSPQDSELRIWNYGLQFGQLFFFGKGKAGFFSYGIAPTLFKVIESARIIEYENDIFMGGRTEELSEWKVGGEVNVKIGGTVGEKVPISLSVRYSLIPWDSDEDKSLTLDYLDSNSISIFSFGLSIGYLFF